MNTGYSQVYAEIFTSILDTGYCIKSISEVVVSNTHAVPDADFTAM